MCPTWAIREAKAKYTAIVKKELYGHFKKSDGYEFTDCAEYIALLMFGQTRPKVEENVVQEVSGVQVAMLEGHTKGTCEGTYVKSPDMLNGKHVWDRIDTSETETATV